MVCACHRFGPEEQSLRQRNRKSLKPINFYLHRKCLLAHFADLGSTLFLALSIPMTLCPKYKLDKEIDHALTYLTAYKSSYFCRSDPDKTPITSQG